MALDAQDLVHATVVGVRDAGCSTVIGAKDAVTSLVDVATGAVWESLEIIKSAVSGSMSTVMGSSPGQEAASGIEIGLGKSQPLADPLLPMTAEELGENPFAERMPLGFGAWLGFPVLAAELPKEAASPWGSLAT